MQAIELPDRQEITLCEAVTAFVYGKACDHLQRLGLSLAGLRMGPDSLRCKAPKQKS